MRTNASAISGVLSGNSGGRSEHHLADVLHRELALAGHERGVGEHVLVVRGVERESDRAACCPTILR